MNFLDKKVQEILVKAADNIIKKAKANLSSGNLKNSLRYEDKDGSVALIMDEYGMFKDKGVTGKNRSDFKGKKKTVHKSVAEPEFKYRSNAKAIGGESQIDKWMYKKGIQGRDFKGRFLKRKTTNFLIRRSIFQHGIKPSLFLTTPYLKYTEQIIEEFNNLSEEIRGNQMLTI